MFASSPDFSDNARALYNYMVSQPDFDDWQFVWLVKPDFVAQQHRNTLFISAHGWKNYLRYLYHLFTSKYLFCTHSHFVEANPSRQISACLWHGTMLKRICAMNEREKSQPRKDQYRFFVSPSKFYNEFFCKSFLCSPEQVLTCGYPRNDFLFQETNILTDLGIDRDDYSKIIVYMPTFRTPIRGGYSDSDSNTISCLQLEDEEQIKKVSEFFVTHKVLLLIKWHQSDKRQFIKVCHPNIISIDNRQLNLKDLQIYHLLHYADALITDYSSVFCDYMMLNRPIAFDIADIDSYANNRGFVFKEPLEYMPGYILRTCDDLLSFTEDVVNGKDKSAEKRRNLYGVYNDFKDEHSSERLLKGLMKYKD